MKVLLYWSRRRFMKMISQFIAMLVFTRSYASMERSVNNAVAVKEVLFGQREVTNAAWWGYSIESGTVALQRAIQSGAKKVIVPNMGTPWIIDPIYLESNQEIEFASGVVLLARKGSFLGKEDCLVMAINKENITLSGHHVIFKMLKEDYKKRRYKKSQWRHCLSLRGCRNVNISGLNFEASGGDGIYIGRGIGKKSRRYCENITIRNVTCDRNYRQGISVISARNLLIEKCVLSNTEGTNPQAGLDLEPNNPDELLQNCILRDTSISNNKRFGLLIVLTNLNKKSAQISVTIEHCTIRRNGENALRIINPDVSDTPTGYIRFNENHIEGLRVVDPMPSVELYL